jgi:hypothetical protein
MVKGFGCRQAYESLSCRNPRSAYSLSYGVFWIVASSGRPIAATVASPGASRVGLADILLRVFGVKESAFAALNALAIGTGTDLPVGLLCFE